MLNSFKFCSAQLGPNSLRCLQGALVVCRYLCTTLNKASAGMWAMDWTGGAYEMDQGRAFAAACDMCFV